MDNDLFHGFYLQYFVVVNFTDVSKDYLIYEPATMPFPQWSF